MTTQDFRTKDAPEVNTVNIGVNGVQTKDDKELVVAQVTTVQEDDDERVIYKVAVYGGTIYDPFGPYSTREDMVRGQLKFRKVSVKTYGEYSDYLSSRNEASYNRANRGLIND